MPDPLVRCRGVSKTYFSRTGAIEALHSVDASVELGEVVALVGVSGSGKSTLIRSLAGLERPTAGELVVAARDLAQASPRELRRHRQVAVTYVSQNAAENFVPHLTLAQHVRGDRESLVHLLGEFGLGRRLTSRPAELSGGEQARGAFALALLRGAPLIVADEPTAELDDESAAALLAAIGDHASAGVTFVIATHDPAVSAIADRTLTLDRGRVVVDDRHAEQGATRPPPQAAGAVVLRASGVAKSYRRGSHVVDAVRDATLELRSRELAVVVGRSGSGKSTLLTLLGGWQRPDSGEIRRDRGVGAAPAWSDLGYLPQRFGLLPELTVRENVEHPARLGGTLEQRGPRVLTVLERLGLVELADRMPHETSIGQQQRTALARALVLDPTVLLADEPTSHQDAGWRERVWELLDEVARGGTSCLIATHEEAATRVAHRVWHADEGRVALV